MLCKLKLESFEEFSVTFKLFGLYINMCMECRNSHFIEKLEAWERIGAVDNKHCLQELKFC